MSLWRLPPTEDALHGHGWVAERNRDGATLSTPTGKWSQGELLTAISDDEFELLRAQPERLEEIFRRYNHISGDGWSAQRDDICIVYLDSARFADNRRFAIPEEAFQALREDPRRFEETWTAFRGNWV